MRCRYILSSHVCWSLSKSLSAERKSGLFSLLVSYESSKFRQFVWDSLPEIHRLKYCDWKNEANRLQKVAQLDVPERRFSVQIWAKHERGLGLVVFGGYSRRCLQTLTGGPLQILKDSLRLLKFRMVEPRTSSKCNFTFRTVRIVFIRIQNSNLIRCRR